MATGVTADEAFYKWWPPKKPFEGYWTSCQAKEMAKEVWDARQPEVARLASENKDLRERLELARCEGCRFENDKLEKERDRLAAENKELIKERDQLRELVAAMMTFAKAYDKLWVWPWSTRSKAKALGIGGEG